MEKLLWWSRASLRWQCQPEAEEPQQVCRRRPQTSDPFNLLGLGFQNAPRLVLGVVAFNLIRTLTGQLDPQRKFKCTMAHICYMSAAALLFPGSRILLQVALQRHWHSQTRDINPNSLLSESDRGGL